MYSTHDLVCPAGCLHKKWAYCQYSPFLLQFFAVSECKPFAQPCPFAWRDDRDCFPVLQVSYKSCVSYAPSPVKLAIGSWLGIRVSSSAAIGESPTSLVVTTKARICIFSTSIPRCTLRHWRRRSAPCCFVFHSPSPKKLDAAGVGKQAQAVAA